MCDATVVQFILTFAVGGLTLRILTQKLKNLLKLQDILAQAFSIAMAFAATAGYILIAGAEWACLLGWALQVYIGMQVVHQVAKPK